MTDLETKINGEYQKILEHLDQELDDYKKKNNITEPIHKFNSMLLSGDTSPRIREGTPDIVAVLFRTAYELAKLRVNQKEV